MTATACDDNDVLYIPTDNTAASCAEAINNVALPAGVPIIAGEEGICAGCGVATLSISYYDLGYATGEMAVQILVNGADVSEMAIEYAPNPVKKYNAERCASSGHHRSRGLRGHRLIPCQRLGKAALRVGFSCESYDQSTDCFGHGSAHNPNEERGRTAMNLSAFAELHLLRRLPGGIAQGLIWGIMALGFTSPSGCWISPI